MSGYEQWGDKANDIYNEQNRNRLDNSYRGYTSSTSNPTTYRPKRTSKQRKKPIGGFMSFVQKLFLIIFIIYLIGLIFGS